MLNTVTASLTKRLALVFLCAGALTQAHAQTMPQGARIGWVSTERLFTESKQAQAADAKIEAEFSKRQKAMQEQIVHFKALSDKFDADAPTLGEPERTRRTREMIDLDKDLQRKQREFREDLMQRKNEERANISQKVYKLIQQIAEQEKLDIVLQESVWFSSKIDITDRLLKQMDR
ncbi:OmpH family outer membrane protein [Massilia glaciei]|uniref:OmpH family outer membrane protein n=1 Tax=Massilia glaciei TaxID=1524097 RepID=A0A2U2HI36_9BURK|nr:OmpH family outer membrane protein [Massilia glaciei]PWF45968.1 OmpH family outer membrane protein [Massilia glaciei]